MQTAIGLVVELTAFTSTLVTNDVPTFYHMTLATDTATTTTAPVIATVISTATTTTTTASNSTT
jgi:microcystin-dependent protein